MAYRSLSARSECVCDAKVLTRKNATTNAAALTNVKFASRRPQLRLLLLGGRIIEKFNDKLNDNFQLR